MAPQFSHTSAYSQPDAEELAYCESRLWDTFDDWVRGDAPEPWNEPDAKATFLYESNGRSVSLTPIEAV